MYAHVHDYIHIYIYVYTQAHVTREPSHTEAEPCMITWNLGFDEAEALAMQRRGAEARCWFDYFAQEQAAMSGADRFRDIVFCTLAP